MCNDYRLTNNRFYITKCKKKKKAIKKNNLRCNYLSTVGLNESQSKSTTGSTSPLTCCQDLITACKPLITHCICDCH